jgi:hypothetical protein
MWGIDFLEGDLEWYEVGLKQTPTALKMAQWMPEVGRCLRIEFECRVGLDRIARPPAFATVAEGTGRGEFRGQWSRCNLPISNHRAGC